MFTAYVTVTAAAVLANGYAAVADFLQTNAAVANAVRVGLSRSWLLPLGLVKAAGVVGLLVGIVVPAIGVAAAVGLVLYFTCAVAAHLRVRWYRTLPFPAGFLLLAVAALVLRVATA
ncbi:DoxX family protein [Rhodococcus sp. NPDC058505]|uniref:DoxX family protein n=1 Tax=unclassified Rhodococcus (in: high G+C Gram-positive bacteria) TaxID=192944 RepID=UPI00365E1BB2